MSEETQTEEVQIPKSRFDDAVGKERAGREEAEARAKAAEDRFQAMQEDMKSLRSTVETRIPEPADDEWVDPGDRALKVAQANADAIRANEERAAGNRAWNAIRDAVKSRPFARPEDMQERLAERYRIAKIDGQHFDPEATAQFFFDKETEHAAARTEAENTAKEEQKRRDAEATSSALTGAAGAQISTPTHTVNQRPKAATPQEFHSDEYRSRLADWEAAETSSVFSQFR